MEISKTIIPKGFLSFERVFLYLSLLLALAVIIGWIIQFESILSIIPGSATMKFNSAFGFLLITLALLVFSETKKQLPFIYYSSVTLAGFIGIYTLIEYQFEPSITIDNLIIEDVFSNKLAGRMSPATALCFTLLAVCLQLDFNHSVTTNKLTQLLSTFVICISLVAIIAYVLNIPLINKTLFFQSMAIHTSVLFFGLALVYQLKNKSAALTIMLQSSLTGSTTFKKIFPFLVLLPVSLGFLLLIAIRNNMLSFDFGLTAFVTFTVLANVTYVFFVARNLNHHHAKQIELDNDLFNSNKLLEEYKYAIDKISIVAITDRAGLITYVNSHFCKISQYSSEELIGNTHRIINSGYHPHSFFKHIWRTISNGKNWTGDIKNKAKDGSFYWVHTVIVPIKNNEGKIERFLSIRRDVTKSREQEFIKKQKIEKLEFKNKELEQFTYIASHDLQEPLRSLKNCSEILRLEYKDDLDEDGESCVEFISEASTRMSTLVKGLLDYSRLGIEPTRTEINLNDILHDLKSDISNVIEMSNALIMTDDLPTIKGYNLEIRLLFQNLISNAIKFSKVGVPPRILIKAKASGDYWHFEVHDNGIGMETIYLKKIFLLFQRLHLREEYEGSGIGLAHCSKIVDLHGGKIWANSELDRGSTFYFTLLR